jgi:hypothetical protein
MSAGTRGPDARLLTERVMVPVSSWFKRKREPTRAEIEGLIERNHPAGSDIERLGWLLRWIVQSSPYSREAMIARARRLGIRPDRAERLLSGDVSFGFRWDLIELLLRDYGAPPAAIEVADDLFHNFPRLNLPGPSPMPPPDSVIVQPRPGGGWSGQNCSVLLTDVVGFGAARRTDQDRKAIREAMYRIVRAAFIDADISWNDCHSEDRGDGILLVVPPGAPTKQLVYPLLDYITDKLSSHNAEVADATAFQLRVALDVGPVESDEPGVNGKVIIDVARLIELPRFKQRLDEAPSGTCLGFIASKFVYDRFIMQDPGQLASDKYEEISGRGKGRRITGWIKLAPEIGAAAEQIDP